MRLHLYIPMKEDDVKSLEGNVTQTVDRKGDIFKKLAVDETFSTGPN